MKITGSPKNISREEVRAIFQACDSILRYHNLFPSKVLRVQFTKRDLGFTHADPTRKAIARCYLKSGLIRVSNKVDEYSNLLTIGLHEMIHLYSGYPDGMSEKQTSTLTAKLKPDVARIANVLVENTYKRAGYVAHLKISYKPKGKDNYNDEQYHHNHESSKGIKYRIDRIKEVA